MKALRSFGQDGINEGHVKRSREFPVANEQRCKELEAHGLAYRIQALKPAADGWIAQDAPHVEHEASKQGPSRFSWWRDWRGGACAIIASGPSTAQAPIDHLRGRLAVIAIKENVKLCPWADVVYGCDGPWWRARKGLPDFAGVKLAHDTSVCATYPDINKIEIDTSDRFLVETPGLIGNGGNSGFQAVNLALQFGVRRILLIGFDMNNGGGVHWYGRNTWRGANNPSETNLMHWRDCFERNVGLLNSLGVDVVNASSDSALRCFRHAGLEQALSEWGL